MKAIGRITTLGSAFFFLGLGTPAVFGGDAATKPSALELMTKIEALQTEVNQLRSQQEQLKKQQSQGSADSVQRVIEQADQHSRLMDIGGLNNAGWNSDKGLFYIQSDDGNFYLHPGIIFQFRYVASNRSRPNNNSEGFEIAKAKYYFEGNLFGKDLTYRFQWFDNNPGGAPTLQYGYGQYVFLHGVGPGDLAIRAGQYKNPVFKEEQAVQDTNQPMVDRSLVNALVGGNSEGGPLVEGVDLMYTGINSPIHADVLVTNGDNSGNTNFTITPPTNNFGAAARFDYKFFGDWAANGDLTVKSAPNKDFLDIGAGVDYSQGIPMTIAGTNQVVAGGVGSNTIRWDVDAEYQMANRFVVYTVFYGDAINSNTSVAGLHSRTDLGGMIEGAYLLSPAWELSARYSITRLDDRFKSVATGNDAVFNEIGAGVTWFMGDNGSAGNHAKVVFDANYLPNGSPGVTSLGFLSDPSGHQEFVFRGMFQIWF